jgi:hypothetical protein
MQSAAPDIYPPVLVGFMWSLISFALLLVTVGGYWLVKKIRIRLALAAQKRAAEMRKPNKQAILNGVLHEIQVLKQAVQTGQMNPGVAAERLSAVVRTAFDILMNHRTMYLAKYETASRNLVKIETMLNTSYPLEYDSKQKEISHFEQLCNHAEQVVAACR